MKNCLCNVYYYAIYDAVAEDFSAPIIAKSDGDAIRMFNRYIQETTEKDKYFVKDDYHLVKLDTYQDGKGTWFFVPLNSEVDNE